MPALTSNTFEDEGASEFDNPVGENENDTIMPECLETDGTTRQLRSEMWLLRQKHDSAKDLAEMENRQRQAQADRERMAQACTSLPHSSHNHIPI